MLSQLLKRLVSGEQLAMHTFHILDCFHMKLMPREQFGLFHERFMRKSNQMRYAIEAEASVEAVGDEINARSRVAPWEI